MSDETLNPETPAVDAPVAAQDAPAASSDQEAVQPDSDASAPAESQPAPALVNVLAKFSLSSIQQQRHWSDPGYATQVQFSAVQGEPFGSATPSGQITMLIVNPDAQKVFMDAWQQLVDHKIGKAPEFYVTFAPAD